MSYSNKMKVVNIVHEKLTKSLTSKSRTLTVLENKNMKMVVKEDKEK